ncbi:MAG TPA: hypothetical protein VFU05_11600 [Cyclobacteriaceae bacterium]|nr:hypothetical protein [Cyclobacteriaceae bacterium]
MMKKIFQFATFCVIPAIFISGSFAFAQSSSDVIPPSPVTREFTKYINQEVALYNGIPEINIPLYSIQLKGLTIPISLSYHASGIKYAQTDGDVGVGWVLNPGYRVSRNVYGHADELVPMPTDFLTTLSNYETNANINIQQRVDRDKYLSKFVFGGTFGYGNLDGEFDQFTFSTPTAGGGFIISDRINKTIATTEDSNLLFDYKTGGSVCSLIGGIKGFRIIDETGNKYAFGEYNTQTECTLETASSYAGLLATAWGMSDITTPAGEQVQFTYDRRGAGEFTSHIRTWTVREGGPGQSTSYGTTGDEQIFTGNGYYTFYPDQIISPNETVTYSYFQSGLYQGKLSNIEISSSSGILKTVKFFYSEGFYSQGAIHHVFLDSITIQDSNQIAIETYRFEYYAKNATNIFAIDHYGNYLNADAPNVFYHQEFSDDHIGPSLTGTMGSSYLSGLTVSRESDDPNQCPNYFSLKKITYPTGGYTEYEYEHGKFMAVGASGPVRNSGIRIKSIRSSDLITQESIVKTYTYGNDENGYGYPPAWVLDPEKAWLLNPEKLFVKEMIDMHPSMEEGGEPATALRLISYSTVMQGDIGAVFSQAGCVKYSSVTEYNSSNAAASNGKTVYHFDIGNTFEIEPLTTRNIVPNENYQGTPLHVYRYRLWDKPLITRKVAYSYSGAQYIPIQEETFDYEETLNTFTGLKVEQSATNPESVLNIEMYGFPNVFLDRYFNYGQYFIEVGKNSLKHKTVYQYSNGNTFTTNYSYDYSNLMISKEIMSRSTGDDVVVYTSYPKDYASGTTFIDDMTANNLIAYPIEQVKYLDDGTNQKVLSGNITRYKTGGKGLKEEELRLETALPIALSSFKFSNRATGLLPPNGAVSTFSSHPNYRSQLTYNAYDNEGNILSTTQTGGLTTSYLWGYDKEYPIAKIANAVYDESGVDSSSGSPVYSRVNQVLFQNFEEHSSKVASSTAHTGKYVYQGSYDIELRDKIPGDYLLIYWSSTDGITWTKNEVPLTVSLSSTVQSIGNSSIYLDDIRFHPKGAQMLTYTYEPLIGMTSQTDAAGLTSYYVYDAYGRLKQMKDDKGNVVKHINYNYRK